MGLDIVRASKRVWLYRRKYLRGKEQVIKNTEEATFALKQATIRGGEAFLSTDRDAAIGFFKCWE